MMKSGKRGSFSAFGIVVKIYGLLVCFDVGILVFSLPCTSVEIGGLFLPLLASLLFVGLVEM